MPISWRKLTDEEIAGLSRKGKPGVLAQRRQLAEEYRTNLQQYGPGDWVEILIPDDEKRETVKQRLNRVAEEVGYRLAYKRSGTDRLLFQVQGSGDGQAMEQSEAQPATAG